jgi:hypothetical protein
MGIINEKLNMKIERDFKLVPTLQRGNVITSTSFPKFPPWRENVKMDVIFCCW